MEGAAGVKPYENGASSPLACDVARGEGREGGGGQAGVGTLLPRCPDGLLPPTYGVAKPSTCLTHSRFSIKTSQSVELTSPQPACRAGTGPAPCQDQASLCGWQLYLPLLPHLFLHTHLWPGG